MLRLWLASAAGFYVLLKVFVDLDGMEVMRKIEPALQKVHFKRSCGIPAS